MRSILLFAATFATVANSFLLPQQQHQRKHLFSLQYQPRMDEIQSPVLRNVYESLLSHKNTYGHPNIPLGTPAGRQCAVLRRIDLSETDRKLLETLGFSFEKTLEDVYVTQGFDELLDRLVAYGGDYSPPKKYAPDPVLGAWVTALRRLKRVGLVEADHVQRLDALGFQWESPRACGSQFMKRYREIVQLQPPYDSATLDWIRAIQKAEISNTRNQYMSELLNTTNWREWRQD